MATTAKKPAAAGKAAKPAAKSGAKAPAKPRAKKAAPPPPEPVVYISAFSVGNKVTHSAFGDGKVTAVAGEQLTIQFKAGEKVILDGFVKAGSKG